MKFHFVWLENKALQIMDVIFRSAKISHDVKTLFLNVHYFTLLFIKIESAMINWKGYHAILVVRSDIKFYF